MKIANSLSLILGSVLLVLSLQWIFMPSSAAESLNMIFLEGEGRNTQIRDFTALFLGTSSLCFITFFTKKYEFIFSCGLFYLYAAIFSIFSTNHGATITYTSLISEVVFASMAFTSAFIYKSLDL